MKRLIVLLMIAAMALPCLAKGDWRGKVVDENGEPVAYANVAVLDRASLISAMRRVMVVSDKTTTLIKFLFEANKVTLTSEDINYAQSAEEQLVCQYDGQPLKMGFKGSDLLELIGNLQSQEMTLKLADPSKAGLILPSEQDEGTDLLMLLMPLLINN